MNTRPECATISHGRSRPNGQHLLRPQHIQRIQHKRRWLWRLRPAALAVLFGVLLTLGFLLPVGPLARWMLPVSAHAYLVRSDPAANALLRTAPTRVWLKFDEAITPATSNVAVTDATNHGVDRQNSRVDGPDDTEMTVSLPVLPPGSYVVIWQAQSADDGHVEGGSFIFQIARADGSVPGGAPPTAGKPQGAGNDVALSGPVILQTIATWLALLAFTFWLGGVIWETWVVPVGWRAQDPMQIPILERASRSHRLPAGRHHEVATCQQPEHQAEGPAEPAEPEEREACTAAWGAAVHFRRLAPIALAILVLANLGVLLSDNAQVAGTWSGSFDLSILRATLLGSRFGLFWGLREVLAEVALALALLAKYWQWPRWRPLPAVKQDTSAGAHQVEATAAPGHGTDADFSHEEMTTDCDPAAGVGAFREATRSLRSISRLPGHLVRGWRACTWYRRVEAILGVGVLLAYALSGHAAAVPPQTLGYAVSVDAFHLVGMSVWLGGLFYISAVLLPVLGNLSLRSRAQVLVRQLPAFSAFALATALVLAATGSLNTTIRLTSPVQLLTTLYGRILVVKIEFFLAMIAISAYHAFVLRPRLARSLVAEQGEQSASRTTAESEAQQASVAYATSATSRVVHRQDGGADAPNPTGIGDDRQARASMPMGQERPAEEPPTVTRESPSVATLVDGLASWLRREALLGVLVLFCVALLAVSAGTLAPLPSVAGTTSSTEGTATTRAFVTVPGPAKQTLRTTFGESITLQVTPLRFGANYMTVTVLNRAGQPVVNASVQALLENLDNPKLGVAFVSLPPVGPLAPGVYAGRVDFTAAGSWIANVQATPPLEIPMRVTFPITVGAAS